MKKFMLIGLVLAAVLALGSCNIEKGGTIKVTNASLLSVNIYVYKSDPGLGGVDNLTTPPAGWIKKGTIKGSSSGDISIDEDGTYFLRAYFFTPGIDLETVGIITDPVTSIVTLALGNTVQVKVGQ